MIDRIARRAGGFAATTAMRWIGSGADGLADAGVLPDKGGSAVHKVRKRAVAGAAAGAVAILSSDAVRGGVERGLRAVSQKVRTDSSSRRPGRAGAARASSNGNGTADLSAKTKDELYALARKKNVPGRSAMSKDELAKALTG